VDWPLEELVGGVKLETAEPCFYAEEVKPYLNIKL
jgi:hypothetical protein